MHINNIISNFLWEGTRAKKKIHLCRLQILNCPKKLGGWGILNIRAFNMALLVKSLWRALSSKGIWAEIVACKYFPRCPLRFIYNKQLKYPRNISAIWNSFKKVMHILARGLVWYFGDGRMILLSGDKIFGMEEIPQLSSRLAHIFANKGLLYLSQIIAHWEYSAPVFKTFEQLALVGRDAEEWTAYRAIYQWTSISHFCDRDKLVWAGKVKEGALIVKRIYDNINSFEVMDHMLPGFEKSWKRKIPTKILLFG